METFTTNPGPSTAYDDKIKYQFHSPGRKARPAPTRPVRLTKGSGFMQIFVV